MKKFLLLLLISGFYSGYSQGWQNICMPGLTRFADEQGNLKVFRSDSTFQFGPDSIFLTFPTIKQLSQPSCLDTSGGSILGRKVYKQAGGVFLFFNFWGDTIYLNTLAGLNDTWRFAKLNDTSNMWATITAVTPQTVLGINDSVKEITLQAKNNSNQNISHILNNTKLLLGKELGFIQVLDLNDFPTNTKLYSLAGKDAGAIGLQELTAEMIFDFNPGDEFHYFGEMSAVHYFTYHKEIRTIENKEILSPGLIRYTIKSCSLLVEQNHPMYTPDTSRFESVYMLIYNMDSLNNLCYFTAGPDEFLPYSVSGSYRVADKFSGNATSEYNDRPDRSYADKVYFPDASGCWSTSFGYIFNFTSGLGETSVSIDVGGGLGSHHELVYFKKGEEEWGTPVATGCSVLLGVDDQVQGNVNLFPNPVVTEAKISFPPGFGNFPVTYKLYDLSGRMVRTGTISSRDDVFVRGNLNAGLYLMILTDDQEVSVSKIRVILSD